MLFQFPFSGKSDNDLFPPHIADQYRRSDEQVLESGQPCAAHHSQTMG